MSNRRRSQLHKSKLEDFAAYCESQGWSRSPTKGPYEVLRMHNPTVQTPLIVWTRANAKEHYTTEGQSQYMLRWYLKHQRFCTQQETKP